ncbi:MAG TPA: aldehyde dehydrogenase family protein [Baekduia sp.]|uniref:aldehyde dehydrogenase family protein n=1 Tax=Baekduia sp. TaxID=2600305 RepID=UPI002D7A3EAB|nr:aldehyde dehydrogenase family protein [Baekduia sp.]HET6507611.1 aldehyde dehydrogenase family protein [Baekduia sp.]
MLESVPEALVRERFYIDGGWVAPSTDATREVGNPTTGAPLGRIPLGGPADVDRAVAAARRAFPAWAATPAAERGALLTAIGEGLQARAEALATGVSREVGTPLAVARILQVGLPVFTFTSAAGFLDDVAWEEEAGTSLVLREPIGVVGAITPWNYPLHQVAAKVAPALAAGCTVVLKPSEVTPLTAFALAEVCAEVGLPPGVLNIVTGTGPVVGEAIAAHPDVDMVSFTGSTRAGRRVSELAARTIKRVALELGGKSANVILDDADLPAAVADGLEKCFLNGGQSCNAQSRMLVPRALLAEAEALAAAGAEAFTVGDPLDPATRLGPMVTEAQRTRVRGMIEAGIAEGGRLLTGGSEAPVGVDAGWFVRPTVLSGVTNDMTIAREEVFGPVLSIIPYDHGDDEAVAIANDTIYGLAGAVWSGDEDRAKRVARRLRTGQVDLNGGAFNPLAPFGGYKQSGNGRELGRYGIEEYLELKALQR